MLELILSSKVGCSPVGTRNEAEKVDPDGWCREGKEKRVGDGFVSSPTTVKKPPKDISSGFFADSTERIPTSMRSFGAVFLRAMSWV